MSNNNLIVWKEQYNSGISIIDEQHKTLVNTINELVKACDEGEAKANEIFGKVAEILIDYVKLHFKTEEDLFIEYKYPENIYKAHKTAHDQFANKVSEVISDFQAGKKFVPYETTEFLKNWLSNHIAKVDKTYFAFLQEKMGYKK